MGKTYHVPDNAEVMVGHVLEEIEIDTPPLKGTPFHQEISSIYKEVEKQHQRLTHLVQTIESHNDEERGLFG
jgi:hypothetical protein